MAKLAKIIFGEIIAFLILTLPDLRRKSKPLVLLGEWSGRRASDNPFHLYRYFKELDIECYFITYVESRGHSTKFIHPWSLNSFWLSLRATHIFYSHDTHDLNPYFLTDRCKKINLWHGVGPKCLGRDNKHSVIFHPKTLIDRVKAFVFRRKRIVPDLFVSPCEQLIPFYMSAFGLNSAQIIKVPYVRSIIQKTEGYERLGEKSTKVLYAPTLRSSSQLPSLNKFISELSDKLAQLELELEVAFHPVNLDGFTNDKIVSHIGVSNLDFSSYMFCITDYSSIMWDWDMLDVKFLVIDLPEWNFHELSRAVYFPLTDCLNFSLGSREDLDSWIEAYKNDIEGYSTLKKGWGYELGATPTSHFRKYRKMLN